MLLFYHLNPNKFFLFYSYEKMYNMSISNRAMNHPDLLQTIEVIVAAHSLSCSHLALTAIKAALTYVIFLLRIDYLQFQIWKNKNIQHFFERNHK